MRNIWAEDDEDYIDEEIELAKLTEEDIKKAEKEFNVNFPKEYIELLKIKNGGYLKYQALPVNFKNSWADDHIPLHYLYGIKKNKGIFNSKVLLKEWGIKEKAFITISGDGHTWTVLDYRNNKIEPEITFIDIEENKITVIFKSFKEMIDNLFEYEDEDDFSNTVADVNTSKLAKELLKSTDINKKIQGLYVWSSSYEDMDELISIITNFLESESDMAIRYACAELVVGLIRSEYITDESIIDKIKVLIDTDEEEIKFYYELLMDFLNEQ
ncbi:SMI1/KNR4 family protein [Peribacillus butanolivorans]|uniref:SMI1/KNR4 family protein n=1 Tax=Peribacillus butanolivorans TaxID=421767 RepID=UPI0036AA9CBD